jgi:hypothetical protein
MKAPSFTLAISASPRGFAFVVFQSDATPFDWGIREIRGSQKNPRSLAAVKKLSERYQPEAIVIEETGRDSRRGGRIRALYRSIILLAERNNVRVARYTRAHVRATFDRENARTRPELAQAVAARIPAFAPKLPPLRKIWMSEDPRQSLFDAAALGITHLRKGEPRSTVPSA